MISVLLGAAGAIAANPTGPETMVVQQGNKVTGLVEDQMGVSGYMRPSGGQSLSWCHLLCQENTNANSLNKSSFLMIPAEFANRVDNLIHLP